jgi:chlorobactene glucosyltransferase
MLTIGEILAHPLFGVVAFLAIILINALINSFALTQLKRYPLNLVGSPGKSIPLVSILVPARNEEDNIANCITSLLNQDYPNYEVLVLDDYSTDRTGQILAELAQLSRRLRVFQGQPLPDGWLGKNWACHQLSQAARGELLLFIDSDTVHQTDMLTCSVSAMLVEKVDMLTALPRQLVITWGERLIVPIVYFCVLAFLPLPLAYRLRLPIFSVAIGQFMLFRRSAYEKTGGYAAIRSHGTDDLALARSIKAHNLPWLLADGGELIATRMYRNFHQAYEGFSKNLFAVFDYRVLPFVFSWLWMGYIFFRPPVELVLTAWLSPEQKTLMAICVLAILEALLLWSLVIWRFRYPGVLVFFYPVIVFLGVWIALRSIMLGIRGQATWKGRTLVKSQIHWF